jgi:hypothetical protein
MAKLVESFQRLQKIETACMPKDDPAPGGCSQAAPSAGRLPTQRTGPVAGRLTARAHAARALCAASRGHAPPKPAPPPTPAGRPTPPAIPHPVYLLDEILELARSSPEQAQGVADALEKKLAHRSPVVKFKVGAEWVGRRLGPQQLGGRAQGRRDRSGPAACTEQAQHVQGGAHAGGLMPTLVSA